MGECERAKAKEHEKDQSVEFSLISLNWMVKPKLKMLLD